MPSPARCWRIRICRKLQKKTEQRNRCSVRECTVAGKVVVETDKAVYVKGDGSIMRFINLRPMVIALVVFLWLSTLCGCAYSLTKPATTTTTEKTNVTESVSTTTSDVPPPTQRPQTTTASKTSTPRQSPRPAPRQERNTAPFPRPLCLRRQHMLTASAAFL